MTNDKIYIMAMAASGKSTFASNNPVFHGYNVVDFAERLPEPSLVSKIGLYFGRLIPPLERLVSRRQDIVGRNQKHYFRSVFEFMMNHDGPIVVLGRRTRDDFPNMPDFSDIKVAMVLIPEEQHRRNCASRKRQLRNPLPFFHHWTTDFTRIQEIRRSMRDYAGEHSIPIYDDFAGAITDMMSWDSFTKENRDA